MLIGEEKVALEAKILLEKRFGPLALVYNATLEAEWEGEEYHEETGEFQQAVGVSYDLNKSFSLGAELLHEIEMPDWENTNDGVVYAGPNASIRYGRVSRRSPVCGRSPTCRMKPIFRHRRSSESIFERT